MCSLVLQPMVKLIVHSMWEWYFPCVKQTHELFLIIFCCCTNNFWRNLWHPCPCCFLVLKALSWKLASKMIKVKVKSSVLHLCSMNTMRKSSWKKLELCIPFKNGMILQLLLLWGKSNCFKEGISKLRYKSFSSTWLQIPITMSGYGSLYHPNKRFFK